MEFYVNNEKLDIVLENEKTVGDVLKSFEEECAKNNATTVNITLNGTVIDAEHFDSACQEEIKDNTKLELVIISQADIHNSFAEEAKECTELANKMMELPGQLQAGKDKEANGMITLLADFIDKFCHTASLSALFPSVYTNISIDGKSLNEFFGDFSQVLNDFEQAIASKDTVLMGDLAEYEISPRLTAIANSIKDL
ncbi:MAG: hypothetical protein KBT11_06690 [Treponema sp.]|nr:hypothetical protein [Candidatus Treponema equifaecale]